MEDFLQEVQNAIAYIIAILAVVKLNSFRRINHFVQNNAVDRLAVILADSTT